MSLLGIGVSGLNSSQAALRTVGHNIANTSTPGYSRQRVELSAQQAGFSGDGFQGTGVQIDAINRIADDYVVSQLRLDTSAFNELDTYLNNAKQVDSLLADISTGIAPGVQAFFAALNGSVDDPSSIPSRQLVINEAEGLADRFGAVQSRLEEQNDTLNQQLANIAEAITSIAQGIATLNNNIVAATNRGQGSAPNDLLDTRDDLLKQLSVYVSVNVVQKPGNAVDVFIGNGQPLVIGFDANELKAVPGERDVFRSDLAFISGSSEQTVTGLITGGQLGGILSFRNEVLDKATNSVGRLALTVVNEINNQHELGLDLDGMFGGLFFEDINSARSTRARVVSDKDNPSGIAPVMDVFITDTNELTESDYLLSFSGPGDDRYAITRMSDNSVVKQGILAGALPEEISLDGFVLTIAEGNPKEGDRFLIQPTRYGAKDMQIEIDRPDRLALASVISAQSSLGNTGSANIVSSEVLDVTTPAFLERGELAPPIVIIFTSDSTYDVLDNTDPAHPVDLDPPLRNLRFTPGIRNEMLPSSAGQTSVQSNGFLAGKVPEQFSLSPQDIATNGYVDEVLTIEWVDPETGIRSFLPPVVIEPGESGRSVASKLSSLTGVSASARTEVTLTDFVNHPGGGALPLTISINGVQVNQPTIPEHPELLNPNYLADVINANPAFADMGIIALSDGETLRLISAEGDDIKISVRGDDGDRFDLSDVHGNVLEMRGAGGSTPALITGTGDLSAGFNFDVGGPFRMTLKLGDGTEETISLDGVRVLGSDVVTELQNAIDNSNIDPGAVVVSMDTEGKISIATRDTGPGAKLEVVDVTGAFRSAFGIEAELSQGAEVKHEATIGAVLSVVMEEGISIESDAIPAGGNLFTTEPDAKDIFLGYQITIDGLAERGDKFTVEFNSDGVSDNRNGLQLTSIESRKLLDNSTVSLLDSYGKLVEFVGSVTSQAQINSEASESLLQQSQLVRDSLSGVSLDEEAADLIRFEQAYNASAQVITVARSLFDTLINTFR